MLADWLQVAAREGEREKEEKTHPRLIYTNTPTTHRGRQKTQREG